MVKKVVNTLFDELMTKEDPNQIDLNLYNKEYFEVDDIRQIPIHTIRWVLKHDLLKEAISGSTIRNLLFIGYLGTESKKVKLVNDKITFDKVLTENAKDFVKDYKQLKVSDCYILDYIDLAMNIPNGIKDWRVFKEVLNFLDPEMKKEFLRELIYNGCNLEKEEYEDDWNELFRGVPLFFHYINKRFLKPLKQSDLDGFDLTLVSNHGKSLFDYCFSYKGKFIKENLHFLDQLKISNIFREISPSSIKNLDKEVFEYIYSKYWADCREKMSIEDQLSMLLARADFSSKKCEYLSDAVEMCKKNEYSIIDYLYLYTTMFTNKNVSSLMLNYDANLEAPSAMSSFYEEEIYFDTSEYGTALSMSGKILIKVVKSWPDNSLYLLRDLLHFSRLNEDILESHNGRKIRELYNFSFKYVNERTCHLNEKNTRLIVDSSDSQLSWGQKKKILDEKNSFECAKSLGFVKPEEIKIAIKMIGEGLEMLPIYLSLRKDGYNYNRVNEFVKNVKNPIHFWNIGQVSVSNLKEIFSEEKIFNLLGTIDINCDFFADVNDMCGNIIKNERVLNKFKNEKITTFEQLHDLLSVYVEYLDQELFDIGQEELDEHNNKSVGEYTIHIPKTSYDLIDVGAEMSICVGSGRYAERVRGKQIFIVVLKQNNKSCFCIEFLIRNMTVIQAKGIKNREMPSGLLRELEKVLNVKDK